MRIRVAIVEDEPETREGLKMMVESSDELWCCGVFESGEAFAKKFQEYLDVDVVLMDIELANGMSGIECVAKLHKPERNVQFLMCTHLENSEAVFDALKVGASGYLVKSAGAEKLIAAIKEVHAGGSPMSPHIARKVIEAFQVDRINSAQLDLLTPLERETLVLLSKGHLYKEIALKHGVVVDTIRARIRKIYEKLQVHNKTDAINKLFPRTGKGGSPI